MNCICPQHQLLHACGYSLASQGHDTRAMQDYLGHKNIQYTVRYTAMAPHKFERIWNDAAVYRKRLYL